MPESEQQEKLSERLLKERISHESVSIDELHADVEKRLEEQGYIFDKKQFVFQDRGLTLGERLADLVAKFGGSWFFVTFFLSFLLIWIAVNAFVYLERGFDPYPFILLNLILSCLAALQAPVIMMSQNRQAQKDRKQEEINLEKDIVDFKQDRLDLILDQKEWALLVKMDARLDAIEKRLGMKAKPKRRR